MHVNGPLNRAGREAERTADKASPWLVPLGRLGHAAVGAVYGLVGVLAAQVALGVGGQTTDPKGALPQVLSAPFGKVLLVVIALGLAGYALWDFVEVITDPYGRGKSGRLGKLGAGITYAGLSLCAVQLLTRSASGKSGDQSARDWTARLLGVSFGQWLVAAVGLGIVGLAVNQFYTAYSENFRKELKRYEMGPAQERLILRLGRAGFAARGVVFLIVGIFLVLAAVRHRPGESRGLGGALATLARQPFGPWLLGAVSLGLIAFGVYMLAQARFRRMAGT